VRRQTAIAAATALVVTAASQCQRHTAREESPLPTISGEKIVEQFREQFLRRPSSAQIKVSFIGEDGIPDEILVRVWRRPSAAETRTLMQIVSPPSESKQALLVIERPGEKTEVISYLPGLRRIVKLSTARRLSYKGMTISVQELIGGELYNYDHKLIAPTPIEGIPTYRVESQLKPDRESDYPRLIGFYRQDTFLPLRVELYNAAGELERIARFTDITTVQGQPTIRRIEVESVSDNRRLTVETVEITYEERLPETLFTEEHLMEIVTRAAQEMLRGQTAVRR
jgi:hypothetical protein